MANLQILRLDENVIGNIESSDFNGLTNLQDFDLSSNNISRIEPYSFVGMRSLEGLDLSSNELSRLDLTGAEFESLHGLSFWDGLSLDSEEIQSLVLNDATLSRGSFDTIVWQVSAVVDVSMVGLTFTGENPSDLSNLLSIPTLDNLRIDSLLYELYSAEFDAFAALDGKTMTVVPEPSTYLLLTSVVWLRRRKLRR